MSNSSVFILEIQELRRPGCSHRIDVKCFTSVKDIKDQLQKDTKCLPSRMQLYQTVGAKGLANQTTLHDLGITGSGGVLFLALVYSSNPQFMLAPAKDVIVDEHCEELMDDVRMGLRSGYLPAKTDMLDCTGGVYFMKGGSNMPAAVFKPSDEEQGMPNNPKGYAGTGEYGLRPFFRPGDGCLREMASYILDQDHFCNVPATVLVHCEHDSFNYPRSQTGKKAMFPKLGSLQRFVPAKDTFEDIGHSLVGVLELQKMALLDMRLLNCDRNASNMLAIRKSPAASQGSRAGDVPRKYSRSSSLGTAGSEAGYGEQSEIGMDEFLDAEPQPQVSRYADLYSLVPIDHGYCLPSHLRIDELDWAWFHCPHVGVEVQPEIRDYVNSIDIDALLAELARQVAVPEDCLYLLRVVHAVIKEGIAAGLTLRDIAGIIARTDEDVPSPLENAIAAAEDNAQRAMEMRAGRRSTTSPSFLKSLQESAGLVGGIGITDLIMSPPRSYLPPGHGDGLGSPAPTIVKQKSVGSPRSGGTASPPQRIGAMKRSTPPSPSPAHSPSDADAESDGYSINSTVGSSRAKSSVLGSALPRKPRSRSSTEVDGADAGELSDSSCFASPVVRKVAGPGHAGPEGLVVRPFPLRSTAPERQRRVVSSELNLEALGQASTPPKGSQAAGPLSARSGYSLSSNSRSPIPPRPEPSAPLGAGAHRAGGVATAMEERSNIAYLSCENIQKLQSSPAMSGAKLLYRDPLWTLSGLPPPASDAQRGGPSPGAGGLGDYFMRELAPLPPPATSVSAGAGMGAAEALKVDLPPMALFSSSAASSPHCSRSSSAFTLHQPGSGSKDRIAGEGAEKVGSKVGSPVPLLVGRGAGEHSRKPSGSAGALKAFGSAQSVGSSGSGGSASNLRLPRPGDPLFTLQSFDDDYARNRSRAAAAAFGGVGGVSASLPATVSSSALKPALGPGTADTSPRESSQGPPRSFAVSPAGLEVRRPESVGVGVGGAAEAYPTMQASLFASDSDFTSQSTGTSYESSWASESPKMSPKVPCNARKVFPAMSEAQGMSEISTVRVQVPVRAMVRFPKSAAGPLPAEADSAECAAGSLCDVPVNFTVPLKGEGLGGEEAVRPQASQDRECTSSVELCGTDTEMEPEERRSAALPARPHVMVHSAVKESSGGTDREFLSPSSSVGWAQPPPKLSRVASFAAFESPPLYEMPKAERQVTRLRQEKRKANATTAEFQQLRLIFSKEMVSSIVAKMHRSKLAV